MTNYDKLQRKWDNTKAGETLQRLKEHQFLHQKAIDSLEKQKNDDLDNELYDMAENQLLNSNPYKYYGVHPSDFL